MSVSRHAHNILQPDHYEISLSLYWSLESSSTPLPLGACMAVSLLSHVVSDLCIGKPAVRSLPSSAALADALATLRARDDPFVFLLDHALPKKKATTAVKVGVADIFCYVCGDENNLADPAAALGRPVSVLAATVCHGTVRQVEPQTSLLEALDLILNDNVQSLLVPIHPRGRKKHQHLSAAAADFCILTQEDLVRHLFNSIALFSPVAALNVASLGLIRRDVPFVCLDNNACAAIPLLHRAITDGTAVAVVTDDDTLVGEISPATLSSCDIETAASAFAALSAGDLMTYIDCSWSPPEFLVRAIKAQLKEKGLDAMAELMDAACIGDTSLAMSPSSASTSSDEESAVLRARCMRRGSSGSYGRRSAEDVAACHPGNSLVAVMAQALAHRVSYVWVVDEDSGALVGVVSFADVLRVLREQLHPSCTAAEE